MARAQNSFRGLFANQRIDVASGGSVYLGSYSSATSLLSADSTGLQVAGGIKVARKANALIDGNSTGLKIIAALVNGTTRILAANSTGIKLADRYISTNTTGNYVT